MSLSISGALTIVGNHKRFDADANPGDELVLLEDGPLKVTGRVAAKDATKYLDRVVIKTGAHTVQVGYDEVLVDGKPPLEKHKVAGEWVWVDGIRVTVSGGGWLFGAVLDAGTDPIHEGGSLAGVPHVSLFAEPPTPETTKGLMVGNSF
jgi:hypothetical protein